MMVLDAITPALLAKAAFPVLSAGLNSASKSLWNKFNNRNKVEIPSRKILKTISDRLELEITTYADGKLEKETALTIHNYFGSRDFSTFVHLVFVFQLTNTDVARNHALQDYFRSSISQYGSLDASDCDSLYRVVVAACQQIFELARVEEGEIRTETLVQANAIASSVYLESINRQLERLRSGGHHDLDATERQIDNLANAIAQSFSKIKPQSFEGVSPVPMDGLYVFPTLNSGDETGDNDDDRTHSQTKSLTDLLEIQRVVVLGDPGGGKTTLTAKIAHDLASGRASFNGIAGKVIPFVVILRDYGGDYKEKSKSVRDYIVDTTRVKYSVDLDAETVQFLFDTGRIYIIFDGLDELLDPQDRKEIADLIDTFSYMNPVLHVMATSRRIGYSHNPLDSAVFTKLELGAFNRTQVQKYAKNWFSLQSMGSVAEKEAAALAFFEESQHALDIRSNPLMLGLMCTLYKRESYIPRSRPDLYEKCSKMLFETWDKYRGLFRPVRFEAHVKFALAYIANSIYAQQSLQSGTTERNLKRIATDYLQSRIFPEFEEAEHAAEELINFCKGRTWVLTEVGLNADSEPLFRFSHRTFLEYYAAVHIARVAGSLQELCNRIVPGISSGDMDVVAELAFQIRTRDIEYAPDEVMQVLIDAYHEASDRNSQNIVANFITRSLSYLVFFPETIYKIVDLSFANLMLGGDNPDGQRQMEKPPGFSSNSESDYLDRIAVLENLPKCMSDARNLVITRACEWVTTKVQDSVDSAELEKNIGLAWCVSQIFGFAPEEDQRDPDSVPTALIDLTRLAMDNMQGNLKSRPWADVALYYSGRLTISTLLERAPIATLVDGPRVPWSRLYYYPPVTLALGRVLAYAFGQLPQRMSESATADLSACSDYVRERYPVKLPAEASNYIRLTDVATVVRQVSLKDGVEPIQVQLSPRQLQDVSLCLALQQELQQELGDKAGRLTRSVGTEHPQLDRVFAALRAREQRDEDQSQAHTDTPTIDQDFKDLGELMNSWVLGKAKLIGINQVK